MFLLVAVCPALSQDGKKELREIREITGGSTFEYNKDVEMSYTDRAVNFARACRGLDPKIDVLTGVSIAGKKVTVELVIKEGTKQKKMPTLMSARLKERDKDVTIYGVQYADEVTAADEKAVLQCYIDLDIAERRHIKNWLPEDRTKLKAKFIRDPDDQKKRGNVEIKYDYSK
jgi:hypothetical protein